MFSCRLTSLCHVLATHNIPYPIFGDGLVARAIIGGVTGRVSLDCELSAMTQDISIYVSIFLLSQQKIIVRSVTGRVCSRIDCEK